MGRAVRTAPSRTAGTGPRESGAIENGGEVRYTSAIERDNNAVRETYRQPPLTSRRSRAPWRLATMIVAVVMMVSGSVALVGAGATPAANSQWTVYHGNTRGSGSSSALASVSLARRRWTSPTLDGQLYGEPLVDGNDVYVATEADVVYALSARTGAVVWSRRLAAPVPSSALPCGNISPTVGVTGTPVIDPHLGEMFLVADEMVAGRPEHFLIGLRTSNGVTVLRHRVDPPGSSPDALLQRTGLTLDHGRVIFGFGGNYGDCATYHGTLASVAENGRSTRYFIVDRAPGESQGAIWMGGAAPVVDGAGNVWVSVGNGSVTSAGSAFDDSDALLELNTSMQLKQLFAPTSWPQNNANDLDMTMAPALLGSGQVVLAGKSRIVYLLNAAHLGGIGTGVASVGSACDDDIDGGVAVDGQTIYLPCLSGTVALRVGVSPPTLDIVWRSSVGGEPAILAAGRVWTVGSNGVLYGLDPVTGAVRQSASIGVPANHFDTPSVGDSLLIVTSATSVIAFAGRVG